MKSTRSSIQKKPVGQGTQGFFNNKVQGKKKGGIRTYRLEESKDIII